MARISYMQLANPNAFAKGSVYKKACSVYPTWI